MLIDLCMQAPDITPYRLADLLKNRSCSFIDICLGHHCRLWQVGLQFLFFHSDNCIYALGG